MIDTYDDYCLAFVSSRCITLYEEFMLMKEFERRENDLENKVAEAQKRFDNEQIKVCFIMIVA
jgi:hypothetical protein